MQTELSKLRALNVLKTNEILWETLTEKLWIEIQYILIIIIITKQNENHYQSKNYFMRLISVDESMERIRFQLVIMIEWK